MNAFPVNHRWSHFATLECHCLSDLPRKFIQESSVCFALPILESIHEIAFEQVGTSTMFQAQRIFRAAIDGRR